MKARHEFVLNAMAPDANIGELCRDAGISRKTGYKWLKRFREAGLEGLDNMSTRPQGSSVKVSGEVVLRVLELRSAHPRWGPKKLVHVKTSGRFLAQRPRGSRWPARLGTGSVRVASEDIQLSLLRAEYLRERQGQDARIRPSARSVWLPAG